MDLKFAEEQAFLKIVCNLNLCFSSSSSTTTTTRVHREVPGGGPRENPRSLSSPKVEKFPFEKS